MDETSILNELKSLILSKTGIRTITPADCKRISIEISKTLNKNVSETTIKRLFGFAVVKHNFSKFTLTTLSEYVNEEYLDVNHVSAGANAQSSLQNWKELHDKATRITDFTLKGIKNRSGMPYEMTISRKFAEHDFEDFFKSDHSFTCFISQPGYGRTILLSHLAEIFINDRQPIYKNSTMLFVTAYGFFNKEHMTLNFEDQLKLQLGIHPKDSLIDYANKNYKSTGGKLVIVIDGFSELVLRRDLKKQLFESIINFICSVENNKSIKLVMSMRSTTWIRFYDCIRHSSYLKTKWFPGNYFNLNDVSNVPPLTEKEVNLILSKIHRLNSTDINPKLKTQLKFPFHIQLYYQLKEEDPHFNYSTNITFYELISRFIQDKIYRSNYYTEKILFLKKIVQLTNFGNKGTAVPKDDLIGELSAFKNAYMELLSDGILMEEKSHEQFHPKEFVRFIHPNIFEYFLFIELLEKFHLRVDSEFFNYIRKEYTGSQSRFQLLQWTIRFIVRTGDLGALISIFDLELNNYERSYLVLFIAENLDYRAKYSPETIKLLREHNLHDRIIKELVNFDFIDACYKESINVLLKVVDTEQNRLVYHSLLAIFDILSLNPELISSRLEILSKFQSDNWIVSPNAIVKLIHAKIIDNEAHGEGLIESLEKSLAAKKEADPTPDKAISYVLIMLLGLFYKDHKANLRLIKMILDQNGKVFNRDSPFLIFALSRYGLINSIINPGKKADQLENILIMLDQNKSRFKITRYAESIIRMMQAYQLKHKKQYSMAYNFCLEPLHLFKTNGLNMNCLFIYNLIIEIFMEANDTVKANEYKYEKLCFIEDNNIPSLIFLPSNEIKKF
ncbi:NACHT domain-containing protein [Pedobacter frigoris]|uniref:NACHT domain-containing protein n=1 Tax=Pedobacter frigoris TaxID=2571272 RepID=A0A4U1CDA4_9SPHI|nr:hypothetical protein [Pedobacter frigoris]TKC04261.1 hypothetical protein FA047_16845 [Pedobacter frigoris]